MDFKSIEGAERFWRTVPKCSKIVLDGICCLVRDGELIPVTVYAIPLERS